MSNMPITAGSRGGAMHKAALAPAHRGIWWPSAKSGVFFHEKAGFLFAVEFQYGENTAFSFSTVLPTVIIPATVKGNSRRRGKTGTD